MDTDAGWEDVGAVWAPRDVPEGGLPHAQQRPGGLRTVTVIW